MKRLALLLVCAAPGCTGVGDLGDVITGRNDPCNGAEPGEACLWAGTGLPGGNVGDVDRLDSSLTKPTSLTFGPDGRGYIVDWGDNLIRRVDDDQVLRAVVGVPDGGLAQTLSSCDSPGAAGTEVSLAGPSQAWFGDDGLLYIAAWGDTQIRWFDPVTGIVKTVAGTNDGFSGDGGSACAAQLSGPSSIALIPGGGLYVTDQLNERIREISASGDISTIAGTGVYGSAGDGGPALDAAFAFYTPSPGLTRPFGAAALDGTSLYISDSTTNRVRMVDLTTGVIQCIANTSDQAGYSGDGSSALAAMLDLPVGLAIGPDQRLYVADTANNAVRAIDVANNMIETVVGNGSTCDAANGECPALASAVDMPLAHPFGVAFDAEGNLYVADTDNNRVVKLIHQPVIYSKGALRSPSSFARRMQ